MRLQLGAGGPSAVTAAIGLAVVAWAPAAARADGTVTARGAYYKERSTRVMQPMLDGIFEVGEAGLVDAHFLVDAITSASASAGSTGVAFTERRYEGGVGYAYNLGRARVGGLAKYSTESDYRSIYAGLRGELDLAQKNTTLGIGGGIGFDSVSTSTGGGLGALTLRCSPTATVDSTACPLRTYAAYASLSQILSRNAVLGVTADLASLHGYQSNPYRSAVVANALVAETHPTERLRQSYAISLRYFLAASRTTIIGTYRYYRDNWLEHDAVGAGAHTPELRIVQQVGDYADASLRYRYYTQDRAFFYQDRYAMPQTYVSDDVKLDSFQTHTVEAKLGIFGEAFGFTDESWAGARIEGILSYVTQQNRFGNAIIGQLALTLPLAY